MPEMILAIGQWLATSGLAASIVVGIAWATRKWLLAKISESVRYDYDTKLEGLRSELRAKESQIAALRDGALAHMVAAQTAASQRRLKAADDLWKAVTEWNALAGAVKHMEVIKFEECSAAIQAEPKLREFFQLLQKNIPDFAGIGVGSASARPYLSDLAWALYSAYMTVFIVAASQIKLLSEGVDARKFFDFAATDKVLISALPDWELFIKQHGHSGYGQLVSVLSDKILIELRSAIAGEEQGAESVRRASEILKASEQANRAMAEHEIVRPPPVKRND